MKLHNRPKLISFLAYVGILEGVFLLLYILCVAFLNGVDSLLDIRPLSIIAMAMLMVLPPLIGVGLLRGLFWGWCGELLLILISAYQFFMQLFVQRQNYVEASIGLLLSVMLMVYMFTKRVKNFFWGKDLHI